MENKGMENKRESNEGFGDVREGVQAGDWIMVLKGLFKVMKDPYMRFVVSRYIITHIEKTHIEKTHKDKIQPDEDDVTQSAAYSMSVSWAEFFYDPLHQQLDMSDEVVKTLYYHVGIASQSISISEFVDGLTY